MTKRILIYGDSNTWGSNGEGVRYATGLQWSNLLQAKLGNDYQVVQEGLPGRIAGDHDKRDTYLNGQPGYEIAMRSAAPFDYLIVALGTNDAKKKYGLKAETIVEDLIWYKDRTIEYAQDDPEMGNQFKKLFFVGIANFRPNPALSAETAAETRQALGLESETVIDATDLEHSADGLHYSEQGHQKLADKMHQAIKEYEDEI